MLKKTRKEEESRACASGSVVMRGVSRLHRRPPHQDEPTSGPQRPRFLLLLTVVMIPGLLLRIVELGGEGLNNPRQVMRVSLSAAWLSGSQQTGSSFPGTIQNLQLQLELGSKQGEANLNHSCLARRRAKCVTETCLRFRGPSALSPASRTPPVGCRAFLFPSLFFFSHSS